VIRSTQYIRTSLLFLTFCAASLCIACTEGKPVIDIEAPQAVSSPMFVGSNSAFMLIKNRGNADDTLMQATLDIPGSFVELHDILEGKMIKVDEIRIPGNKAVLLRPVGPHIMLFNLPKTMGEGSILNISLLFKKSGARLVPVPIVKNYVNYKAPEN